MTIVDQTASTHIFIGRA